MPASEPILPSNRNPSEGGSKAAAFAGTVTDVKVENGVQTLNVRFSQGRIRVQAEGEFQPGEKVRLAFPGNGAVQVEKTTAPALPGDPGLSYRLPQNMPALRDLRAFEQHVAKWLATASSPGAAGNPADTAAAGRSTLPQLLMKALDAGGGADFLRRSAGAYPDMARALMDALEDVKGEAGQKGRFIELLRAVMRPPGTGNEIGSEGGALRTRMQGGAAPDTLGMPAGNRSTGLSGYAPVDGGGEARPWFGRIMENRNGQENPASVQRHRAGGPAFSAAAGTPIPGSGAPPSGLPGGREPLFRYRVDMGGRTMEVFSPQSMKTGEFSQFELERRGAQVVARFSDPAAALPADLRKALSAAPESLRQGMLLAAHHLRDFQEEPYFGKLVRDFGEVLAQSGRLAATVPGGRPEALPDEKEMDGLLRLFVAFPRDTERPERQSRTWGEAGRDPRATLELLKSLRPEADASLLRTGTALRLAAEGRAPEAAAALMNAAEKAGETPETTAAWLRKLLPEAFKHADLLYSARETPPVASGKEQEAARFMLQALVGAFPREDQLAEGRPSQFFFYQGQEWRNLQVTWEKSGSADKRGKQGAKQPLQVRVETSARNMGRVEVAVSWEPPKGAKLDFRNQLQDVRELFSDNLPELEKSLALLGFRVTAWTYARLPEASPDFPDAALPPAFPDGARLNLLG